jgi:enoyl-CoA hydratase
MSLVEVESDSHVAVVRINRPDKLNALSPEVLGELDAAIRSLATGPAKPRCAVLTGVGKAFVAGGDISAMAGLSPIEARRFAAVGNALMTSLEDLPFPVIAAVNGFALGGGCELALACDFIYASELAKFGQPEVKLGVIPGFGGTQRLARRVGVGKARELVYTGEIISASEAQRIGLVNAVFHADDLLPKTREVAKKIAEMGPLAVAAAKRVILRGEDQALTTANDLEATAFSGLFGSHDQREGMTAFLEKRSAAFEGR